jgi:lysophospholipase L1-like esterase
MKFRLIWLCALLLSILAAQEVRPLSPQESLTLFGRAVELMESIGVALPELGRSGGPVAASAGQAVADLKACGGQDSGLTYTFLVDLRAFLVLADAAPKPYPLPAEASRQLAELRDVLDRSEAHFRTLLARKEAQIVRLARNPDRDNLARYADANAKLPAPAAAQPRVVFLGDSITDFWRLNEYFGDRDFVNRGISGQVTSEMLGRMDADVLERKPAAVLILAGTNDIARGTPPAVIESNLTMMADLAEFHRIPVLFASLLPVSDYHKDADPANERTRQRPPETLRKLNAWIQDFCNRRGFTYVDYYSALVDSAGRLRTDASDDGLHPNSAGYRLMAPLASAAIDRALAPVKGKRKK